MMKLMMLFAATIALSACQHASGPSVPDSSCVAYEIIRPSQDDTIGTKRQVLKHNRTYRRLCTNGS